MDHEIRRPIEIPLIVESVDGATPKRLLQGGKPLDRAFNTPVLKRRGPPVSALFWKSEF